MGLCGFRLRRLVTVGVVAAAMAGCHRSEPETEPADTPVGVTVQTARIEALRDLALASGVVVPSTAADLTIYAPEAATITELPKGEGDEVAVGAVLVKFAIPTLMQEMAAGELAVADARARADRAKAALARMADLYQQGMAARNAYEAARADQMTSESMLGQATTQLELLKVEGARATVTARFPGRVVKVWHAPGDFVTGDQTDPIIRVVDPTRVQVAVELPVVQLARIIPGQLATIRAFTTDTPFLASVAMKPASTDANAPTGQVRLTFNEPATLPIDAPVSVEILLDQRLNALVVPTGAVLKDNLSSFVVVAGDDQRAHRRDVRVGLATRTSTQIVSGLDPGERVIVTGLNDVAEGTAVVFAK